MRNYDLWEHRDVPDHRPFRVCHLCVGACNTHAPVPTLSDYGPSGFLQPDFDFQSGHCDFNCSTRGSISPTGAILPLKLKEEQRVQLGKAVLNENRWNISR